MRPHRSSLLWRAFAVNAAVLLLAGAALALTPATVSNPVAPAEAATLALGVCVTLLVNLLLLRRTLGGLDVLAADMAGADALHPPERAALEHAAGEPGLRQVLGAYTDMRDRLAAERRASARRAAEAQEEERRRVARELHDEVGQTLTALLLTVDGVARDLPADVSPQLEDVREAARRSLDDVRRIARSLRPEVLDDLGLAPALLALTKTFARSTRLPVERALDAATPRLPADAELAVYRIAQEALTNVARHAGATSVSVSLRASGGVVRLAVRDDGRGLPGPADIEGDGGGLRSMRERALLVGGELAVGPAPGGGTLVALEVPVTSPPAVRPTLRPAEVGA